MKLSRLIRGIALTDRVGQDVEITSLTCDSRMVTSGALFVAIEGERYDGTAFIQEAMDKGAAAVVCRRPPENPGPWLLTEDPRRAFGLLSANWFGRPGDRMTVIGVTGTNGKTTTTYLLKWVLEEVLHTKVGLIGTNQNLIGEEVLPAERTTPDAYTLHHLLAQMELSGCTHVVMEVSSHALAQERTAGLWFRGGIFTNLTRDHLDFHGTMEAYAAAKERLFSQCQEGFFNLDDSVGRRFAQTAPCVRHTYSENKNEAEVLAKNLHLYPDHVSFTVVTPEGLGSVTLPIPGGFTVYNALGVIACTQGLGLPLDSVTAALARVPGVKGRAEVVPVPAPYTVLIDYAHTPDALEKILTTARSVTQCRLLCLFGCGGDRDRSKRPIMGEIAAGLSDGVILTSDNPRTEAPEKIMHEIAAGFPRDFQALVWEPDRRKAIRAALAMGRAGDVILLAGKGHETYQEVNGQRNHLDEREEIASFFRENGL